MARSDIMMVDPQQKPETPQAVCKMCGKAFWSETLLKVHLTSGLTHERGELAMELTKCYVSHK